MSMSRRSFPVTLIPRFLTSNALWAIHVISALVCAGIIILTGLMARLLGGAGGSRDSPPWPQPRPSSCWQRLIYGYDVFDDFWWTLAATVLIVLLRDDQPRCWLAFGLVAGLGLLTKETILFWGFALVVGLLLTPQRRLLFTRWTLLGGLIAFALFLPFLIWNAPNGWASLQYWASYSANHGVGGSPIDFVVNQILSMNPFSVLLWGAGLWYYFSTRGARFRVFGWAYLILFVLFIAIQGKTYFLAPAYPTLFAGGAMVVGPMARPLAQMGQRVAAYAVVLTLRACCWPLRRCRYCPPPCMRSLWHSSNGGSQQARATPTACPSPGGSLRLGAAGRLDRPGLSQPAAGSAARRLHLHRKLRRGQRARAVRRAAITCRTDQRTQRLLPLGHQRLHRPGPHHHQYLPTGRRAGLQLGDAGRDHLL